MRSGRRMQMASLAVLYLLCTHGFLCTSAVSASRQSISARVVLLVFSIAGVNLEGAAADSSSDSNPKCHGNTAEGCNGSDKSWFRTLKDAAMSSTAGTIAAAVAGGTAAVVAAPVVLGAAGFTAGGVAAGSLAATAQAALGGVGAGSVFAALQSAGAAGVGWATAAGGAAVGSGAKVVGGWLYGGSGCEDGDKKGKC